MTETLTRFSLDDIEDISVRKEMARNHRSFLARHFVSSAYHAFGLVPNPEYARKLANLISYLTDNATRWCPVTFINLPAVLSAEQDGPGIVWTVGDKGPGIMAHFKEHNSPALYSQYQGRQNLLLGLIHDRIGTDINLLSEYSGLGLKYAVDYANELGCTVELKTDNLRLALVDGRMEIVGGGITEGTTWTIRSPK